MRVLVNRTQCLGHIGLVAVAMVFVSAGPIPAGHSKADVRCFLAISSLADSADPAAKQLGLIGGMYYQGRVDARVGTMNEQQLQSLFIAEAEAMTPTVIAELLTSCGREMEEAGKRTQRIGAQMEAYSKSAPGT